MVEGVGRQALRRGAVRLICLYLRSIAFGDIVLLIMWFNCLPVNIGDFWGVLVPVLHSCRVAFPLVMLSGLKFSLVLAFRVFVRVFIGVKSLIAIVGDFKRVSRLAFAPLVR